MRPQRISPHHIGVVLQKDSRRMALLGIAPNERALHKDTAKYVRQLELLAPHLSRAIEMNRLAARAGFAERALEDALDAIPAAAFLLDGSGRVLVASALAQSLMREERVVGLTGHGRLQASRTQDKRAFEAALAAGAALVPRPPVPVPLASTTSGRTFLVWVLPARSNVGATPTGGSPTVEFYRPRTVLVIVTSADKGRTVPVEVVMAALRLSAAEARLVTALCTGQTLAEYAEATGLSRNTVRNELAAVFEKTGTRRQAELVALVLGSVAVAANHSLRSGART